MEAAESAAAAAAVEALRQPVDKAARSVLFDTLAAVHLDAASHFSIVLACSKELLLYCGNILLSGSQGALFAGPTLAAACMQDRRAKLFRHVDPSSCSMEDVSAIVRESGCGVVLALPLIGAAGLASGNAATSDCGAQPAWAAPCLGALTIGFPSTAHITLPALKGALLLARAVAEEQQQPLLELAGLVARMLLRPPHEHFKDSATPDPPGWDTEGCSEDNEWRASDYSDSEDDSWHLPDGGEEGPSRAAFRRHRPGAPRQLAHGGAPEPQSSHPLSLLAFTSCGLEQRFAAYHATHMLRVDGWAYLLTFCFFCVGAFLPGTPFRLWRHMGWSCLLGCISLLPGVLLLTRHTRAWYCARRDLLLAFTWLAVTAWQTSAANYLGILGRESFRHPLYLQSYGWLLVMGLAFQMRFRFQALAAPLAFAINASLLPSICATHFEEQPATTCAAVGALRVFLHSVTLPLACCYAFESQARRLFLRARRRGWRMP